MRVDGPSGNVNCALRSDLASCIPIRLRRAVCARGGLFFLRLFPPQMSVKAYFTNPESVGEFVP